MMFKKILTLLFILPFLANAQNNVKIHCRFTLAFADSCLIKPAKYFIDDFEPSIKATINEHDGTSECNFNFAIEHATVAQFLYNKQSTQIYIEPGDEMELNIATDSLYKAITFSGQGSVQNEFLNAFYKQFNNDFEKEAVKNTILNTGIDAFEMKLYDERKKQLEFYNNYKDKNSFSESFKKYVENTIRYNYFSSLLSYPIINANQSTTILTVTHLPDAMLEGIDSKLVNDEALNCQAYRDFLYYYAIYFTSKANGFNKFKDMSLSMESKVNTANKNFSGQSLIWYLAWFLNSDISKVSQYTAKHIYGMLSEKENNGAYTKLLKSKYDARMAMKEAVVADKKADGSSSSSSSNSDYPKLKDIDGKEFTFEDLKGKVVYVDFWATWCGPCRQQMPYSKQLHEMFTPKQLKQIVFLYISIDEKEDLWKSTVKQIGMEGKIAISPGNWNSEIIKYFQINSIPRYMLIDKKGKFVDLNAKRPGSGQEIYNDIMQLLD